MCESGTSFVYRHTRSCREPVFLMEQPSTKAPRRYSREAPHRQMRKAHFPRTSGGGASFVRRWPSSMFMGRLQEGQNALHMPKVVGKPNFTQVPRKGDDIRRPTLRQSSFNPANAVQAESSKPGATRNLPPGQECLARSRSINARSGDKASTTSFFLETFWLDCGIMAIT